MAVQLVPCGVLLPGPVQYCLQHSCIIAVDLENNQICRKQLQQKLDDKTTIMTNYNYDNNVILLTLNGEKKFVLVWFLCLMAYQPL